MQYQGSCHCGAVRYQAEVDLAKPVISCNCSHCGRKGFLWSFIPADRFKLLEGEDAQTEYRFNTEKIQHLFCKTCGVESFARGEDSKGAATASINVRCLEGVDLTTLNVQPYDGAGR